MPRVEQELGGGRQVALSLPAVDRQTSDFLLPSQAQEGLVRGQWTWGGLFSAVAGGSGAGSVAKERSFCNLEGMVMAFVEMGKFWEQGTLRIIWGESHGKLVDHPSFSATTCVGRWPVWGAGSGKEAHGHGELGAQQVSPCRSTQQAAPLLLSPRLAFFFKLHEMVPKWGPLSPGAWELTVPGPA